MPTGPNGEKRPSDPAACAHHVFKIMVRELPSDAPKRKATRATKPRSEKVAAAAQNSQ